MNVQVQIGKDDIFLILSRSSVETSLELPGLKGLKWESFGYDMDAICNF